MTFLFAFAIINNSDRMLRRCGGIGRRKGLKIPRSKERTGSSPVSGTIKTHAKGAYKTPPRVSFSMQNRGKLPFSWQFTLFVVSSHIAVGICSSLALKSRKPLTIVQKGFLHDKERMISSVLINEKMTDRTLMNAVGRLLIKFLLLLFRTRTLFRFPCWTAR